MNSPHVLHKITPDQLRSYKVSGEAITCLTAYDASFAVLLEKAGIEVVLVGDSLGMVLQGHDTTLPVTLEDMEYHSRCVARVLRRPLLVVDMPYQSYSSPQMALDNARRLVDAGAEMVKLEGGHALLDIVDHLVSHGIAVCGHLGLLPQSVVELGGYRVQGRDEAGARAILQDALDLQQAGAQLLVLECIPAGLARQVTQAVDIPTIGIGAGVACDGQVLVLHDLLGVSQGKRPKFVMDFLQGQGSVLQALQAYVTAVKARSFPGEAQSY